MAVKLLLEHEEQGIAADVTNDALSLSALQHPRMLSKILQFFEAQRAENPTVDTYSSLIYACVKLRQLDAAFGPQLSSYSIGLRCVSVH